MTDHLLPVPLPCQDVECKFTIPASVEQAWRDGQRHALTDFAVQMAKDAVAYCRRRYEMNLQAQH